MGINICQGALWSEELDGKELHGVAWWRVRSGAKIIRFFPVHGVNTVLSSIYKSYGIMLVLRGRGFCLISCTPVHYLIVSFLAKYTLVTRADLVMVFERNLHLLTSHIASLSAANTPSGRVVSENSRVALVIRSELWDWGGYYRTARPLEPLRLNKVVIRML